MSDRADASSGRFDRARLGAYGEQLAAEWYEREGYEVLARNWRCREGELDLVVARDSTVVIAEVKTRSNDRFGSPFDAITPAKARRLRVLAAIWARNGAPFRPDHIRIDVVGVVGRRVEVIEGAL